jgi:catechol 2,3-dioxygenase-like lactoylglutathione lyase family enzyme
MPWYSRPVVSITDFDRAAAFYLQKLGFKEDWRHFGDDGTRIIQVSREGCELILSNQWPERAGTARFFVSLDEPLLETLAAFRADMAERGVPVRDGAWGYHLAIVADPDGNELWFPYPHGYLHPNEYDAAV